jgi:hypothetical protein
MLDLFARTSPNIPADGTQLFRRRRSAVFSVYHGADGKPKRDRFFNGGATGVSGCTCDQYFAVHF